MANPLRAKSARREVLAGPEDSQPLVAHAVLGTLAARLMIHGLNFVSGVLVARFLGPDLRGLLAFLLIIAQMSITVGSFGFHDSITYFAARDRDQSARVFGAAILVSILVGIVYALALLVGYPVIERFLPQVDYWMVGLVAVGLVGLRVFKYLGNLARGLGRFRVYNLAEAGRAALYLACLVMFALATDFSIHIALIAFVLATSVTAALMARKLVRFVGFALPDGSMLRDFSFFGLRSWPGSLASVTSKRLDFVLLPALAGVFALGQYAVATQVAEVLLVFPVAIGTVLLPTVAKESAKRAGGRTLRWLSLAAVFYLAASAGIILVGRPVLLYVFGEAYSEAYLMLLWLLPGVTCLGLSHLLTSYLIGSGRPGASSLAALLGVCIAVPAYLLLIPRYGGTGAAMATSAAYLAQFASLVVTSSLLAPLGPNRRRQPLPSRQWLRSAESETYDEPSQGI